MLQVLLIPLLFGLLSAPVSAAPSPDSLDVAKIVRAHPDMPARGTSMKGVRERLGDPREVRNAVGDPPITRWVYDEFTVFFEGERVLHSVMPRRSGD